MTVRFRISTGRGRFEESSALQAFVGYKIIKYDSATDGVLQTSTEDVA